MGPDPEGGGRRSTTSRGSKIESAHNIELRLASTNGEASGDLAERATEYRTYRRRWFGLAQLTLLNIIVSWDVS